MGNFPANPQIPQYSVKAVLWLCLLLVCSTAWAQDKINKKAQALYDESSELLHWDKFDEAESLLLEALKIQPDYIKATERLGYVYYQNGKYALAHQYVNKLVQMAPNHSKEAYFYLARTGLATLQFDEGLKNLAHYRSVGAINDKREAELNLLEQNLLFAKGAIKDSFSFKPANAGPDVNTEDNEYFPSITADGSFLYFTRQKQEGRLSQEDIMVSQWANDAWQGSYSVSPNINTNNANQGAHSISPDGNSLYFTQCEGSGGYGSCDIYVSRKRGNVWSKPVNLGPNINTRMKETQPCISPDGTRLYFVSSREGGYGKLDIWVSQLQPDGQWGTPENLGPSINTAEIDERPYIHTDNRTLYFSSDGHPGFGDADIYLSRRDADGWGKAVNLGYPLNSYNYEGGIYVSREGEEAYFATDRYSKGGDLDVYHFPLPPALRPVPVTYVRGTVKDKKTGQPLTALINFTELESSQVINEVGADVDGSFFLILPTGASYALNISRPGYLFHSQYFSLDSIKPNRPYTLQVALQPIEVGERLVLSNIFYEKNAFALKPESKAELNDLLEFLKLNPTVSLEISGHTDNTGTDAINKELSQNRAGAVVTYLINQGIAASRLQAKGYGSSAPIATNDTEEGRAQNRRTEIKVLGK